jgi:hypothetical protein
MMHAHAERKIEARRENASNPSPVHGSHRQNNRRCLQRGLRSDGQPGVSASATM